MLPFLNLLKDGEYVVYFTLGVISLRFFYHAAEIQLRLRKSIFGLERQLLQGQRNGAVGVCMLLALTAATVYGGVHYLLPEILRKEQTAGAGGAAVATPVPSPTPYLFGGVDISGCANPKATILEPKPGDTVRGPVDIRLTANMSQFAFYRIEVGSPDSADVWMTLNTDNQSRNNEVGYTWDSSTMPPGVYHLRLVVTLRDGTSPRPCVIPIQVLSTAP
jgi:hypothetical protein